MLILMFWYLQWEGAKRASEQAEGTLKHNYLGSRVIPLQKDEHSLSSADPEPTCKSSPLCLMWLYILYSNREISFYLRLSGHTDVLTSFFLLTSIQSITERHWFAELVFYPGCLDYISCTMGRGGELGWKPAGRGSKHWRDGLNRKKRRSCYVLSICLFLFFS